MAAGAFLSTIISPTAAHLFENNTVRIMARDDTPVVWNNTAVGYGYIGCFTSDPSIPALDAGVNVTAPGRMTPEACLYACKASAAFLKVARQARAESMQQHFRSFTNSSSKGRIDDEDEKNVFYQTHPVKNGYPISAYDHDNDEQYQYAGVAYDAVLDAAVCTCSDGLAAASENVADAKCNTPCDGNLSVACGGPNLLVLYNLTQGDHGSDDGSHHGRPVGTAAANGVTSIGVLVSAFLLAVGCSL
ncbi:hypothetical protein SLS62_001145 [Diatrype stigma]|uniref:WSC domain-containing protein n=1 Tax=Diatrype stigma TaxID=117547 RepID=A0AAN9V8V9_9PEZI